MHCPVAALVGPAEWYVLGAWGQAGLGIWMEHWPCCQGGRAAHTAPISPSRPESVLAAALPFSRVLGLALLCAGCSFKPLGFFLCPRMEESVPGPLVLSLPTDP